MSVLWLVAVLAFLGVATYESYSTIHEYLQYPTVTKIRELVARSRENLPPPQITVCNLNPFPSDSVTTARANNIILFNDFKQKFQEFKRCTSCSTDQQLSIMQNTRGLTLINAYYQYIGEENAIKIGHKQNSLIAKCQALEMNGFHMLYEDCVDSLVSVSIISTPEYFNCYQFYIDYIRNLHILKLYYGIWLVIYLDVPPYNQTTDSTPTGAKVMLIE